MVAEVERKASRAAGMFHALANRNFRLFWTGAFLSNAGTWMQMVAQAILVYNLTNSPFWLGVDSFMTTAPGLVLTLFGGALADSVNRKRLIIFTQAGAGLSALVLGVFLLTGVVKDSSDVWIILLLSFVTGSCWAFSGPAFQAITFDLVEREELAHAIALNSMQFQVARVIGPTLAGLTMSYYGLAGCFLGNGLSYVAIVTALTQVRFEPKPRPPAPAPAKVETGTQSRLSKSSRAIWADLMEGFRYVGSRPRVRLLLFCSALVSFFAGPYLVLTPVFAKEVFGWGDTGVSLLMGMAGAGALCGALMLTYLGDFKQKGWFALASSVMSGVCLFVFAVATHPALALPALFGVGLSMVSFFAVNNTLVQQLVTDQMRGRVMSMWILTLIGTMPLGSFLSGIGAARYGAQWTLAICGLFITLLIGFIGLRNARLREL
ncbi:MAG TPA: MFS transporter [Pyrinomonadaceae bacterium]|jgi:MFS family permease